VSRASATALIREGWELHRSPPPEDPDLALLLGDRRYAAGLLELVADGDLEGVRLMAGVISECARSLAEEEPERAQEAWSQLRDK
jgi:hypothetical protein